MADMTVAQTILEQLGGKRFRAMTGATSFVGSDDTLSFKLPSTPGYVRQGINGVRITLTPLDTYTVQFLRFRLGDMTTVATVDDVYCDMLQEVFTRVTGLATRL